LDAPVPSFKGLSPGLKKRLIFSAAFIALALLAIFAAPNWFFFLVIEGFGLAAFSEFLSLAEKKGIPVNRAAGLFLAAILCLSAYFRAESLALVLAVLVLSVLNFARPSRDHALVSTAVTLFGMVYVVWFFSHFIHIRLLPHGSFWIFYTLLLAKGGDAGAYFVGKKFGRTKLIEHISPNKSVEGAFGQFAVTVLLSLVSKIYLPQAGFSSLFLMGAVVGILAQLGDLAESVLKRDAGVKDSGQVPGLGGILDVLDSLLLTIPSIYYAIVYLKI